MIRRRHAAVAGIILLGLQTVVSAGPLRAAKDKAEIFAGATEDPYTLAVRAYVWGYPLVRAAQLRHKVTMPENPHAMRPASVAGAPINSIGHARALSTPETRIGVAPNNDTLYSLAWLDLAQEPYVLTSPDFGQRYYTFQFGQADTSTDQSLGQSTHGRQLPPLFIHGPAYKGQVPNGMISVRSHYRYLIIAGRILVNGQSDLPAVHALQDRIQLRPLSAHLTERAGTGPIAAQRPFADPMHSEDKRLAYLEMLGTVLRDWDAGPHDATIIASLRALGLTQEHGFRPQGLTTPQRAAIAEGIADGEAVVRSKTGRLGRKVSGWSINYAGPRFGDDYLLRAAVAMDQIYILEPQEALYPSARTDGSGAQLDGRYNYRIRFTKEQLPPVNAFWSITLYFAEGFMAPNAIDRWAIGDRTPGLVYGADGSLDIRIQHERPERGAATNWLPAPKEPFMLLMRLYNSQQQILDGTWTPPAIDKVE